MATLKELREQARSMDPPIEYAKETTKEQLEEMIAERLAFDVDAAGGDILGETIPLAGSVDAPPPQEAFNREPAGATHTEFDPPSPPESSYAEDININEADLNNEYIRQASLHLKYATMEARAQAEVLRAKLAFEVKEAEISKLIRIKLEDAAASGGKEKVTEKKIENEVISSKDYQDAKRAYFKAMENADILKGVVFSFVQRRDMLIQLGSTKRQEADQNSLTLKEKAAAIVGKRSPVTS